MTKKLTHFRLQALRLSQLLFLKDLCDSELYQMADTNKEEISSLSAVTFVIGI